MTLLDSKKINIAIDGHSSCGKSTLAKALAHQLNYTYIDSGAMYRAVTLYTLRQKINVFDQAAVAELLPDIHIRFEQSGTGVRTLLNDRSVEEEIRSMEVSAVRKAMVRQQQHIGRDKGVVMDGRDIGTVVFPDAEVKLFVTAEMEERVRRRHLQLKQQGKKVSSGDIRKNLYTRDYIDSTRSDSPLTKAPDAVLFDNTSISEAEQMEMILALIRHRLAA